MELKLTDKHDQKRSKFRSLAENRTNKALNNIRLIGNLSNTQSYAYDDAEIDKIVKALRDAISEMESRFRHTGCGVGAEFRL